MITKWHWKHPGFFFGKGTTDTLRRLPEKDFLSVFDVPQKQISRDELLRGISIIDLVSEKTGLFPSKSEARRMLSQGGVSINKSKINRSKTRKQAYLICSMTNTSFCKR